jgi:N-acetylglucosamine malate deacetylase 2
MSRIQNATAGTGGSPRGLSPVRYAPGVVSRRPADPAPITLVPPAPPAAISVPAAAAPLTRGSLPRAAKVLAVIARPGQESADLGALLYAFRRGGASLALLCVTRGEASPLNSTCERLETRRPWELLVAGAVIGISSFTVADYPDGALTRCPLAELTELVQRDIRRHAPDLLLIVDPAAGRPDDAVVARAVCAAARLADLSVVARTMPGARGARPVDLGPDPVAARAAQRSAAAAHASQSEALPEVERRLGLLGHRETLRWLVPASADYLADPAPVG